MTSDAVGALCDAGSSDFADSLGSLSGLEVGIVDDMCEVLQRNSLTSFGVAVADSRVWVRSCRDPRGEEPAMAQLDDLRQLTALLDELVAAAPFDDVEFLVNLGDQPVLQRAQIGGGLPVLEPASSPAYWSIAMPSPFHVRRAIGEAATPPPDASAVPWEARARRVWWRGELSVPDAVLRAGRGAVPRLRALRIAREHPQLFDLALSGLDWSSLDLTFENSSRVARALRDHGGLSVNEIRAVRDGSNYQPVHEAAVRYRYALNLNAVVSSWRLHDLLLAGATPLLQASP